MNIDILTLFPAICEGPLGASILGRAREKKLLDVRIHNLRDWATGKHRVTDDTPFGGGQGMVLKPEPIFAAVERLRAAASRVILLSPQGRVFRQEIAHELAALPHLIFICGHYEGVDHRVAEHLADEEISLGDFVLTNGAIAAAVIVDAVARLLPGVLGHADSAADDSFSAPAAAGHDSADRLLEAPQYTRPAEFRGWRVPPVLLSGDHAAIARWRREQALARTRRSRPDLLQNS
ncbi:MAG: tRNA (guanosine(37)-N1)-methyltransferase TrmD [Verrucomicrobia bacterium]|nr:tRNA (guanosine(37)-N1)-methyltransferase TrmD [Verrucomicrobiota bacterium]